MLNAAFAFVSLGLIVLGTILARPSNTTSQDIRTHAASSCTTIDDLSIDQANNTITLGQDFTCKVAVNSAFPQPSSVACGLVVNGSWPKDICRYVTNPSGGYGTYGFQGYSGNTAIFKCNTNCINHTDCSPDSGFTSGTYQLVGFDFASSCGPTIAPALGKSISVTVIGNNTNPAPTNSPSSPTNTPAAPTPTITECGSRCVYSQLETDGTTTCHVGNCKDPAKPCGFNNNCWYNPDPSCGISSDKGQIVDCTNPTLPALPTIIPTTPTSPTIPTPSPVPPECTLIEVGKQITKIVTSDASLEIKWSEITALIDKCAKYNQFPGIKIGNFIPPSTDYNPAAPPKRIQKELCQIMNSGPCAWNALMTPNGPFTTEDDAKKASMICFHESRGIPNVNTNKACLTSSVKDYSVGLFQINIWWDDRCPSSDQPAFSSKSPYCVPIEEKIQNCENYYLNPTNNIAKAFELSHQGKDWHANFGPAANDCGF